jgi:hypothetical protein
MSIEQCKNGSLAKQQTTVRGEADSSLKVPCSTLDHLADLDGDRDRDIPSATLSLHEDPNEIWFNSMN